MSATKLPLVYLVRHGETEWTISGRHTGRTDIPLTANGERTAIGLSGVLDGEAFASVLTSPLQRARRTAELAGFGTRMAIDGDLVEWDYGSYDGLRTSEIRAARPDWKLFEHGCPGGEVAAAVGVRADRVVARIRSAPGGVLVFAHRDVLRVLIARWIGLDAREGRGFTLDPASVSVLGYDHGLDEPIVRRLNGLQRP